MDGTLPGDTTMKNTLLFMLLVLVTQNAWSADVLYLQSTSAKLLGRPSFNAPLIEKLQKGAALEVMETSGRWIKVQHKKKVGWLPRLLVSKNPPVTRPSLLQGRDDDLESKARRRASSSATAAATRGLRNDDRSRKSDEDRADYQALKQVESVTVKESDVDKFQQEGLQEH